MNILFRIVDIDGVICVQKRGLLGFWRGIDNERPLSWKLWYSKECTKNYCSHASIIEARDFLFRYKRGDFSNKKPKLKLKVVS